MSESLGEALPKQMAYIRDIVIPAYQSIGPVSTFAVTCMKADLDRAAKAMIEGDIVAMIDVYSALKAYKL